MWTNAWGVNGIKLSPKCQNTVDFAPFSCTQTNNTRGSTATTLFRASCNTERHLMSCFLSVSFSSQAWRDYFESINPKNYPQVTLKISTCTHQKKLHWSWANTTKNGNKPQQISLFSIHLLFPMFLFLLIYFDSLKITNQTPYLLCVCVSNWRVVVFSCFFCSLWLYNSTRFDFV